MHQKQRIWLYMVETKTRIREKNVTAAMNNFKYLEVIIKSDGDCN